MIDVHSVLSQLTSSCGLKDQEIFKKDFPHVSLSAINCFVDTE